MKVVLTRSVFGIHEHTGIIMPEIVCIISKVRGPNLVTHLKRAPKSECGSKHGHQKDEEI
jgi:hypothetical protein